MAEPRSSRDHFGILLMAHGGSPEWNAQVLAATQPLGERFPVEVAFGMAEAGPIQVAVQRLEARGVTYIGVVRLFVSGESWYERTEQILGLVPGAPNAAPPVRGAANAGDATDGTHADRAHADRAHASSAHASSAHASSAQASSAQASSAHAVGGDDPTFWRIATHATFALSSAGLAEAELMGAVLVDRARALSREPSREVVLLIAHGPGDDSENARWLAQLDARAEAIRQAQPFRRVVVETLREDWPAKRRESEARIRAIVSKAADEGLTTIVIPFRVQGFGPYAEVLRGLDYLADGRGLLPHAAVSEWLATQAEQLQADTVRAAAGSH